MIADRATKVARLFSQRKALIPPVDILAVISSVAIIEFEVFPGSCAALLVRNTGQPRVIVSPQLKERQWHGRLRFTLAHELAHLVLPWQIGTFFCHPDDSVVFSDYHVQMIEAEANRFASELLVPQTWLRERADAHQGTPSELVANIMRAAEVSAPTALFACTSILPPGHTLAILSADHSIQYINSTAGSFWNAPRPGEIFPYEQVRAASGSVSSTKINERLIISVKFNQPVLSAKPSETASELLKKIILDLGITGFARQQIFGAVNGIVGALNGGHPQLITASDFLSALKQRFSGRPELTAIIKHGSFNDFLLAKSYELEVKRNAGK